ncbi:hypothetical protein [Paenibacillus assamensis]|uniref:hypothetical protein n=1 Tax=Paenibacillus assamensis TaxID=311244 RepID=UPI00040EDF55|nr:hypothetical protein [Paenibacillus assamensis]
MTNTKAVIQVQAFIKSVENDVTTNGYAQHYLRLHEVVVMHAEGIKVADINKEITAFIRYGDEHSFPEPITGLAAGQSLEIKGVYLDKNTLDPIVGSPDDAVLYYAHRPVGYVVYGGKRYE